MLFLHIENDRSVWHCLHARPHAVMRSGVQSLTTATIATSIEILPPARDRDIEDITVSRSGAKSERVLGGSYFIERGENHGYERTISDWRFVLDVLW